MFDVVIINGSVIDGTGSPAARRDVGVAGGRIAGIGDFKDAPAAVTIDADGKYVCPGFIDTHSHSDTYLLIEPSAPSKIYQGITTEVVGNCGASAAPLVSENHMPSDWSDKKYPGRWRTTAEFRRLLEEAVPALNVVMLVGHNTLRRGIAGYENRPLTESEMQTMIKLLEESLGEGARGFSTGLIYAPGIYAPREELLTLARVTAGHGGIYTSHMRNEGAQLLEAIEEIIAIAAEADATAQISHLKTSGRANWGLIDNALDLIRQARSDGVKIAADRYPYTSACTDMDVIFPGWAQEGGREKIMARLRDPSERSRLKDDLLEARTPDYWATVTVGSTCHPDNLRFRGMPLTKAAKCLDMSPVDTMLKILEMDELKTSAFFFGMSEENMVKILAESYVMIGTDASLRSPSGPLSGDYPHPRAYGSVPRFLKMALEEKTVDLPDAVRKMTSLPADHFGLKGRGVIEKGAWADVTVFNPGTVCDKASYSNPHQLAEGIDCVIVNGKITLTNGRLTGDRAGRIL